jgi:hypothetical protein
VKAVELPEEIFALLLEFGREERSGTVELNFNQGRIESAKAIRYVRKTSSSSSVVSLTGPRAVTHNRRR